MKSQHPTPAVTPLTEQQVANARDGMLAVQRCDQDGSVWYPPSTNCPACLGTDLSWIPASGRATLWSWVTVHQPYLKAFTDEIPYLVAYVKLEEGPFLMSTIMAAEPDALRLDQPLELAFEPYGGESIPMPVFRAAS